MARKNKQHNQQGAPKGLGQKEKKFLHLKEFSNGKPNELSLNVLEQKAASLDEPPRRGLRGWLDRHRERKQAKAMDASHRSTDESRKKSHRSVKSSKHANKVTTPKKHASFIGADYEAEVALRQKRRRRYRRFSIAVVAMICVGLLGTAGYWYYQEQQRLSTSIGVLREACDIIAKSDNTTVAIDEFFQQSFNDDTVSTAKDLKTKIPAAKDQLESARVYAQKAESELDGSQKDKEAAQRTLSTIASRETILNVADERLADDIQAKQALDSMNEAQGDIEEGNALLAQAAKVVSDTNEANVGKSTEYTTSAKGKFEEAKQKLEDTQQLYPRADLSTVKAYVDKKSTAAGEALASNAAILLQDKATAEAHNDAYNQADDEATQMAQSLPQNLTDLIVQAYSQHQESMVNEYNNARADAASHDAFLRQYLKNG
ncbi:MAG: hypothetical protein ACLU06_01640 [Eggerthellaceae bacterium]